MPQTEFDGGIPMQVPTSVEPGLEFVVTATLIVADVARSTAFYRDVLGAEVLRTGEPTFLRLGNIWLIINVGGGPTDDKPEVTATPPRQPNEPLPECARQRHQAVLRTMARPRRHVHHGAEGSRKRGPLPHARSGWLPDRGWTNDVHGRTAGPVQVIVASPALSVIRRQAMHAYRRTGGDH